MGKYNPDGKFLSHSDSIVLYKCPNGMILKQNIIGKKVSFFC